MIPEAQALVKAVNDIECVEKYTSDQSASLLAKRVITALDATLAAAKVGIQSLDHARSLDEADL